ncbi:MAG TPA: type I-U CRISPR-associated helicase/endonuclease Cas3 [Gemmataceae bacterium]|nr:type I-U CRISPR-associated helicase/endonuclease Cas3 [Gemmataceae bacterium]
MAQIDFDAAFSALTGNPPFPWQRELYKQFMSSDPAQNIPAACSIPTGLGKTRVIVIWVIALANGGSFVPRRLVYAVNRRTVVDQSTRDVEEVKKRLKNPDGYPHHASTLRALAERLTRLAGVLDPEVGPLAVSTLRGKLAETREWWENPARPAVVVGTIDLIGSRLLFQGYRAGFKYRPLYGGFLGQDALLVHDEAHLEPAFQRLIEAITCEQHRESATGIAHRRLRVMAMTATPRTDGAKPFELTDSEKNGDIPAVRDRLFAEKGLKTHTVARDEVIDMISTLALQHKDTGQPILVFARTVQAVAEVRDLLTSKRAGGVESDQVRILTGTIRGYERDGLATDPVFVRFLPTQAEGEEPRMVQPGTVYLICTSAGEVGVDLSAAHLVCDLTPLDSLAQRFGRVNRRGTGPAAEIDIVYEADADPKKKDDRFEKARWATREVLENRELLPACAWDAERQDASPAALGGMMSKLSEEQRIAAFSPMPTILPTSDILFDAWALTTIGKPLVDTPLPGRPPVAEYLHGVEDKEQPDTQFAWRDEVDHTALIPALPSEDRRESLASLERYLDAYPLKPHELLTERTFQVVRHLKDFAKRAGTHPAWIVDVRGGIRVSTIVELSELDVADLIDRTIVLPPGAGGLTREGLLNPREQFDEQMRYDVADDFAGQTTRPRVRFIAATAADEVTWSMPLGSGPAFDDRPNSRGYISRMTRLPPVVLEEGEEGSGRRLIAFVASRQPDDDESQSRYGRGRVTLQTHLGDVELAATAIADALRLPRDLREPLIVAARFHDLGKGRKVWQQSIGNRDLKLVLAKSGKSGPLLFQHDYRHEFGSLIDITKEAAFAALTDEKQDLVLHLIATHHGRGRPHFPAGEVFDRERGDDAVARAAGEVPRRFARLQRKYGRWGLAWLESLLRAADAEASANPSEVLHD